MSEHRVTAGGSDGRAVRSRSRRIRVRSSASCAIQLRDAASVDQEDRDERDSAPRITGPAVARASADRRPSDRVEDDGDRIADAVDRAADELVAGQEAEHARDGVAGVAQARPEQPPR